VIVIRVRRRGDRIGVVERLPWTAPFSRAPSCGSGFLRTIPPLLILPATFCTSTESQRARQVGPDGDFWHIASVRYGAALRLDSEVRRTCLGLGRMAGHDPKRNLGDG